MRRYFRLMQSTDLATDPLLRLPQAARLLGVARSTVLRWITTGHHGVKLTGWRLPDGWRTRQSAILDFGAALAQREGVPTVPPSQEAGAAWAAGVLRRFGVTP